MPPSFFMTCVNPVKIKHEGDWLEVPCGKCIACLQLRAKNWANRIILEARYCGFDNCCFLTLTYDNIELEKRNEVLRLDKRHIQLWLKRFRKDCDARGKKIRYYCCGEYGTSFYRPHYHVVLFGLSVTDIFIFYTNGKQVCSNGGASVQLKSWPYGYCFVAGFSEGSAFYVASYLGKSTPERRRMLEKLGLPPEFPMMSRKPGIGCKEVETRRDYYARHPVSGWKSIDAVKPFARHCRYLEEKIFTDEYKDILAFENWKSDQRKKRTAEDIMLAESQGVWYGTYMEQKRIQHERNLLGKCNH